MDKAGHNHSARALRAVWLVMFNQGGWWTSAQLRAAVKNLEQEDCYPSIFAATLHNATLRNYVAMRPAQPGTYGNQYAVMPTCHVPRCVTVGEVLK